ncbi:MAG: MCP four helix bundle domain-containing protein [Burkholderiales bacterium]|nr:MCP four helix bundle domain-containing protein [Burkholderiales bacterium]
MKNLSIKVRLSLLVAVLLFILVASAGSSVYLLKSSNAVLQSVYLDRVVPLRQLKAVGDAYGMSLVDAAHKVRDGSMKPEEGIKVVSEARVRIDKEWREYIATYLTPQEKTLIAQAEPLLQHADAATQRLLDLLRKNDMAALTVFVAHDLYPLTDPLSDALDQLSFLQLDESKHLYEHSQESYQQVLWTNVAATSVVLLLSGLMAWLLIRAIIRDLSEAVRVADTVAQGDLSSRIEVKSQDETGRLLTSLKRMNDNLITIVGQVRNASDSIATGSAQIAMGNADLSQRTEEQASNLQQTAASMEQLTTTVTQNSDTARQANQLATSASVVATQGGEMVSQVVVTMERITASSRKISDIIGVIDGIAFQTNILALNAAVEAARAGEQGRGFAVVASEVRSLAQRSAQAAKEIKSLISESVKEVEGGSKLVDDAGHTMKDIVTQVKRVTDLIGEISSASSEQSSGIGQIGNAVSQLDQVTQQNAALVEESAAAAESLKHQAAQLAQTVSVFRLA